MEGNGESRDEKMDLTKVQAIPLHLCSESQRNYTSKPKLDKMKSRDLVLIINAKRFKFIVFAERVRRYDSVVTRNLL